MICAPIFIDAITGSASKLKLSIILIKLIFYDAMKFTHMTTLVLLYCLILLSVFLLQRKMLYFPQRMNLQEQQKLVSSLPIAAWPNANEPRGFISNIPLDHARATVLVFHGNAGSALQRTYFIDALQALNFRVIIAEYPGYGVRSGTPSESVLINDGITTAQQAVLQFKEPLILCGESLGTGVVAGIVAADVVPIEGLLMITPFDEMSKVAQHHYWYFLAHWLLLDRYDNADRLRHFAGRVAVIMAEQDEVIPVQRTLTLFSALKGTKRLWRFNAGHNSLPVEPWQEWWQEVMNFLVQSE